MAVTQQDIDTLNSQITALNAAIRDGVRQVTLPGGQVTIYQTTESLIKARNDARDELAAKTAELAGKRPVRRIMLQYSGRGY